MLARLWWKELRVFWPLWACIGLFAALVQWMALKFGGEEVRGGLLTPLALGWATLYAFAVSAAAFAGERETNTLLLLDAMPVGRRLLWRGKAGFALASTLYLAALLVLLASIGTRERVAPELAYGPILIGFGTLLVEAIAWGLFWSALCENALTAAVLAIVSVGAVAGLVNASQLDRAWAETVSMRMGLGSGAMSRDFPLLNPAVLLASAPVRIGFALAALFASRAVMERRPRPNPPRRVRVAAPPEPPGPKHGEHARLAAVGRLAWQAWREARRVWRILAPVGLGATALLLLSDTSRNAEAGACAVVAALAALVAGVGVFGPDNRGRTARFYIHHAARPTTVWLVKTLVGVSCLAVFVLGLLLVAAVFGREYWIGRDEAGLVVASLAVAFASGQLCGLLIQRGITATAVAFLATILTIPIEMAVYLGFFQPPWTLALVPMILLGISWAWCGDWMLARGGMRSWLKLGALLTLPFAALVAAFLADRVWGVPDIGPPFPAAQIRPEPIPPGQDAAEVYRQALRQPNLHTLDGKEVATFDSIDRVIQRGWDPREAVAVDWWRANSGTIALIRRAAALPRARFRGAETMTYTTPLDLIVQSREIWSLARLMALDVRERQSRGDLAGAWDDILVILRMAEQVGQGPVPVVQAHVAIALHHQAIRLAIDWTADPRQTPELLRKARDLPPALPIPSQVVKAEWTLLDRTLRLPTDELAPTLAGTGRPSHIFEKILILAVFSPSWERERARRVGRLLVADLLQFIDTEPWVHPELRLARNAYENVVDLQWPPEQPRWRLTAAELEHDQLSTPLLRILWPNMAPLSASIARELTYRRAFMQLAALRSWQLRHGGALPDSLEALVPSELTSLPVDPYSGRPFLYKKLEAQALLPRGDRGIEWGGSPTAGDAQPIPPGRRVLYSVGPDGRDNGGLRSSELLPAPGDAIFPVPEFDEHGRPRDEPRPAPEGPPEGDVTGMEAGTAR